MKNSDLSYENIARKCFRFDRLIKLVWFVAALISSFSVFFILCYIVYTAIPIFQYVGIVDFIFNTEWNPTGSDASYGIGALIVDTILVTAGAVILSVPLGLSVAVYLAYLAPIKIREIVKPIIELLAGIPSVVYGFFGMVVLCSFIRGVLDISSGFTWLAASVILGIMALPTIISISEDALFAVPKDYMEASLGLGTTYWHTIASVLIPAAASGIAAAILLGIGRVVGETMAVMMVAGNAAIIPEPFWNLFSPVRTLTSTLGIEMSEVAAGSMHYYALFGAAAVLLFIVFVMNLISGWVINRIKSGKGFIPYGIGHRRFCLPSYFHISPKITQRWAFYLIYAGTVSVIVILGIILGNIFINGIPALSLEFLIESPSDLGRAGGILPAIIGTFQLIAGAVSVALIIGVGAAVYLTEYSHETRFTQAIRSGCNLLNSTPSIVFGLFGYAFLVIYLGFGICLLAGQICLMLMILPTIIRTTEEALKTVPASLREASLGLGATRWQTIKNAVLPAAMPGILTGTILSIGRAAGETAPIMFTAVVFSKRFITTDPFEPVMALPFHLYVLSTNVPNSQAQQYATAVVLITLVVGIYLIAILLRRHFRNKLVR